MIILKKTKDQGNQFDTTVVTLETEAIGLNELLEDIAAFLKGCGYQLQGLEATYGDEEEV